MNSSFNSSASDLAKNSTSHRSVNSVLEQHQTNTTNTNASNSSATSSNSDSISTSSDSNFNNPSPFPSFQSILTSDVRARKDGLGFKVSDNHY